MIRFSLRLVGWLALDFISVLEILKYLLVFHRTGTDKMISFLLF